jgi:hypothetical protein
VAVVVMIAVGCRALRDVPVRHPEPLGVDSETGLDQDCSR